MITIIKSIQHDTRGSSVYNKKKGGGSKDFKEKKNHCFRLDLCAYKTKMILRESLAMRWIQQSERLKNLFNIKSTVCLCTK